MSLSEQKRLCAQLEGKYITFKEGEPNRKTLTWGVYTKNPVCPIHLGNIKWWGAWRKYCFFPISDMLFEEVCLREIAEFIQAQTTAHRRKSKI